MLPLCSGESIYPEECLLASQYTISKTDNSDQEKSYSSQNEETNLRDGDHKTFGTTEKKTISAKSVLNSDSAKSEKNADTAHDTSFSSDAISPANGNSK